MEKGEAKRGNVLVELYFGPIDGAIMDIPDGFSEYSFPVIDERPIKWYIEVELNNPIGLIKTARYRFSGKSYERNGMLVNVMNWIP